MKRTILIWILLITAAGSAWCRGYTLDESEPVSLAGIEKIVIEILEPRCVACVSTLNHDITIQGQERDRRLLLSLTGTVSTNRRGAVDRDRHIDVETSAPFFQLVPEKQIARTSRAINKSHSSVVIPMSQEVENGRLEGGHAEPPCRKDHIVTQCFHDGPSLAKRPPGSDQIALLQGADGSRDRPDRSNRVRQHLIFARVAANGDGHLPDTEYGQHVELSGLKTWNRLPVGLQEMERECVRRLAHDSSDPVKVWEHRIKERLPSIVCHRRIPS